MNDKIIKQISQLFIGCKNAHGVFTPERFDGKKQVGKCITVREEITVEKWERHLAGQVGLGVIPIDENNQCIWAAVDIDDYQLDYKKLLKAVEELPFVVCKSKSGGVHMYLFLIEPILCKDVRDYLRNTISSLGLGNSEIFPKQDIIYSERGDVGNWINMPYFGDTRPCIMLNDDEVVELEIEGFLLLAESKKTTLTKEEVEEVKVDYSKSPIIDGPPCLQALSLTKFPSGTRNISLFNLGVYAKKAYPNEWSKKIEEYNRTLYKEPLLLREVDTIRKSLDKKDYYYQCNEEPLCSFCNSKLCRTRRFGISATSSMPIINSVTKITGDMSMWFIDVEGGRLELTTEELYDNRKFLLKCINSLNILPRKMKAEQWFGYIQQIVDKAIIVSDDSMFVRNEIIEHFHQFIMSRITIDTEHLDHGRVVFSKRSNEIHFKLDSFLSYLKYKRIQIDKGWVVMYLKNRGVKNGVGKNKERKSFRYLALQLTEDELVEIEERIKQETAI